MGMETTRFWLQLLATEDNIFSHFVIAVVTLLFPLKEVMFILKMACLF